MPHNKGFRSPPRLFTQLCCIKWMPCCSGDVSRLLEIWRQKKYIKRCSINKIRIEFNQLYVKVNFDNKFTVLRLLIYSGDRKYVDAFNILEKNTFSQGGQLMRKKKTHTIWRPRTKLCPKRNLATGSPTSKVPPKIGRCLNLHASSWVCARFLFSMCTLPVEHAHF